MFANYLKVKLWVLKWTNNSYSSMYQRPRYDLVVSSSKQENDPDEQETITDPSVTLRSEGCFRLWSWKICGGVTQHQSLITRKNVVWHFLELGQRSAILYTHTCKSCQKMYTKWPIILIILGEDSICVPFFFLIRFLPFNEYYVAIEIQYSLNFYASCHLIYCFMYL